MDISVKNDQEARNQLQEFGDFLNDLYSPYKLFGYIISINQDDLSMEIKISKEEEVREIHLTLVKQ